VILSQRSRWDNVHPRRENIKIGRLCLTLVMFSKWFLIVCSFRISSSLREYCCIWHFEFGIFDLDIAFEIRLEFNL